jgi:hypothetical protein
VGDQAQPGRRYRKELRAWQQRATAHEQAEQARAGQEPEWTVVSPPALREHGSGDDAVTTG